MDIFLFTGPYIGFAIAFVLLLLAVVSKNEEMTLVFSVGALAAAFYAFGFFGTVNAVSLYQPAIAMGALAYTFLTDGIHRVAGFMTTLILFLTL